MFVEEDYDLQIYLSVKIRVGQAQLVAIMDTGVSVNFLPVRMATALALKSYPVKRQLKVPGGTLDVQNSGYHLVVYQTLITNRVIEVEMESRKSLLFEVVDEENFTDNWVRHLSLNMNEYSVYSKKLCKLYLKLRSLGTNLSKDDKEKLYEKWLECEERRAYLLVTWALELTEYFKRHSSLGMAFSRSHHKLTSKPAMCGHCSTHLRV
ncbi:hypothetical protein TYRP_017542 [Tyrophagus putrescentiae]|nr:hypothetical protein TYRP_017542 [Tyrophagus putrescentiae]